MRITGAAVGSAEAFGTGPHALKKAQYRKTNAHALSVFAMQCHFTEYFAPAEPDGFSDLFMKHSSAVWIQYTANTRSFPHAISEDLRFCRVCVFSGKYLEKVRMLMTYTGENRAVADPWYTDDFETAYADILRGCQALLAAPA